MSLKAFASFLTWVEIVDGRWVTKQEARVLNTFQLVLQEFVTVDAEVGRYEVELACIGWVRRQVINDLEAAVIQHVAAHLQIHPLFVGELANKLTTNAGASERRPYVWLPDEWGAGGNAVATLDVDTLPP